MMGRIAGGRFVRSAKERFEHHQNELRVAEERQYEESSLTADEQGAVSRSLINVSFAHRELARRQFKVQQIAYWMTVIGLLIAEASAPLLSAKTMFVWLCVSVVTWFVRLALFLPVSRQDPVKVKDSLALKLLPIGIILIASIYWVWTISLFSGPVFTVRELFMCIGLLSISLAMTGMWPVTPVAVVLYNLLLWASFSISIYTTGLASLSVVLALDACVFVVLYLNTYYGIKQVEHQLSLGTKLNDLRVLSRKKQADAEEALRERNTAFNQANHDFHQKVHGAKIWLSLAKDKIAAKQSPSMEIYRLGGELDSLQRYMKSVLEFALVDASAETVDIEALSVQSLFQKLDLDFEQIARDANRQVRFRFSSVWIRTDSMKLFRVMQNLVANALKYTRKAVLVSARVTNSGDIVLEVWDQGPGIPEEAHSRIFEPFRQEESDPALRQKGLGLGLAIVRRYTSVLGYSVEVRSRMDRGTVFRVRIPSSKVVDDQLALFDVAADTAVRQPS